MSDGFQNMLLGSNFGGDGSYYSGDRLVKSPFGGLSMNEIYHQPNYGNSARSISENKPKDITSDVEREIMAANAAQQKSMEYNQMEAQKARDWQEKMYGSRGQRTIQDIKKAGLNPYIVNMFSPGGFASGSAASIASNVFKSYSEAKNRNVNKREAGGGDGLAGLLPIVGAIIGSFINPALGAIGGTLGHLGARALIKKNR